MEKSCARKAREPHTPGAREKIFLPSLPRLALGFQPRLPARAYVLEYVIIRTVLQSTGLHTSIIFCVTSVCVQWQSVEMTTTYHSLKMTTAQVVETLVTVNNNSPIQDYVHPDDQTQPTFKMAPGFKPFTVLKVVEQN